MSSLLGGALALVYHLTYTGKKVDRSQMVYTLVLLCLGGALVWLIVANNLVRAFGLAGALAMIRYRTRMQDPKDTTMVFFAIIIGMACGLHQYFVAVFGTAFVGLVLCIIKFINEFTSISRNSRKQLKLNGDKNANGDRGTPKGENTGEPAEDKQVAGDEPAGKQ